jgi:hypothetical protein
MSSAKENTLNLKEKEQEELQQIINRRSFLKTKVIYQCNRGLQA